MRTLQVAQTIYARAAAGHTPSVPPIFPFESPNAEQLWVTAGAPMAPTAVAISGTVNALIFDMATCMPAEQIAYARVNMLEAGGVDPWPMVRLLGAPIIIQNHTQIRQNLVDLIPGGRYVAWAEVQTPAGRRASFVAPFTAEGQRGNYLVWDIPGYPPFIMTDDDGVPITADY
jgi:hypothetical protein